MGKAAQIKRACCALKGLWVGDSFGSYFEGVLLEAASEDVQTHQLPPEPWYFTDDTNMALSIFTILCLYGGIEQDKLAESFAHHYSISRGYGESTAKLLRSIRRGQPWRTQANTMFDATGSFGNGAAMRIAPLGAYFADDFAEVVRQARLSSEITHSHPEGIAGGIAAAVAVAQASYLQGKTRPSRDEFISLILPYIPDSEVLQGIIKAVSIPDQTPIHEVVRLLGNGSYISAQDTLPLCLWICGKYLDQYEEAMWNLVLAGGDVDTTCAITGGIIASYCGEVGIPTAWKAHSEPLPEWPFTSTCTCKP